MSGGSMEYMYSKDPLEQLGLLRRYLDTIETLARAASDRWEAPLESVEHEEASIALHTALSALRPGDLRKEGE